MSHAETHYQSITASSLGRLAAAPFVAFFNWLVRMGESTQIARELNALSMQSDAYFAAQGTTREQQIHKILSSHTAV